MKKNKAVYNSVFYRILYIILNKNLFILSKYQHHEKVKSIIVFFGGGHNGCICAKAKN
jgi:hypothetical protein